MKSKIVISLLLSLIIPGFMAQGQELVSGLQSNREIIKQAKEKSLLKSKGVADTLELPVFDDFSNSMIFPDDSLWSDNNVYINNTYPIDQLSLGVATFDALDSTGLLYEQASSIPFEADRLTSNPINLEGDATDNFYFSFFYQAQGIADAPEQSDSLTLQFYSITEDNWFSVWRAEGSESHPFKAVIIKIDDPRFTNKGFRFRFANYATLSTSLGDPAMVGNADQWHIDYIYLNSGRHDADTILRDAAFTLPARSILRNYESMPWNQFQTWSLSEMGDSLYTYLINNDTIERNVTRGVKISDIYEGGVVYSPLPLAKNIAAGTRTEFGAPIIYTFNSSSVDSALFEITTTLLTDVFDNKVNDTLRYYQVFSNYYSVDDGSSESGYGINGQGADNAIAVYRFNTLSPDSLRAISICFNDSYQNANQRYFDLVILDSDNQAPGDIIYTQQEEMVDPGESINGFITYHLDAPVFIDDYFFVGWRQRSETFLNAGLDLNTPPDGRQYYFLNGSWYTSQVKGSLMIRPIVGGPISVTAIDNISDINNRINIWPNPANDILHIEDIDPIRESDTRINIYSSSGILVISYPYSSTIDITQLAEGVYILVISKGDQMYSRNKFIRTR